jgi:phenylalanyl-tRNA synthetase beta chain
MRIPLSWLKDWVEISEPAHKLAQRLTFAGLEVESIEYIGLPAPGRRVGHGETLVWDREKILVGRLLEVTRHPNADRLTLAAVDYGRGEPIQVVTGAPNIRVGDKGQKVVLALEGSRLYDGHKPGRELMTLKKSKLRGVESGSMVCSEKELGLSEEHEGIIILPDDAPVGMPLADYMGDVVFDIKINPNMARAQSVLGVGREVAALTGQKLKGGATRGIQSGTPETDFARIEIADPTRCARYSAVMIRGVEIKPSPYWMQRRLELAGMRPISNIVDITNYVMIDRGQPLHAFDYDKLAARAGGTKPTINVRPARLGEKIETLDSVVRELKPTDLLITDTTGPIAIAGVMGGAETEVSAETKNVLLEAANFNYISIRRTTQEQKLPSEAATRFGRGIHPSQTVSAALRAAALMHDLGGGDVDVAVADAYPAPIGERAIELSMGEVKRILGVELSVEQITRILEALDFDVELLEPDLVAAIPPNYRLDVDGSDDLIEELARVYGYDRIPSTLIADELPRQYANVALEREERARDLLINTGLQEIVTYAMTNPANEARLSPVFMESETPRAGAFDPRALRPYVEIENPVSADRSVMRQSLLPSDLEVLASNLRFANRAALFEIGKVYLKRLDREGITADELPEDQDARLPFEKTRLAIVMTGPREQQNWSNADTLPMDFFDIKGVVEELARSLHLRGVDYAATDSVIFHPGRAALVRLGEVEVGVIGELHPVVRERFDLPPQAVLVGEFDLEAILNPAEGAFRVKPLSRYPVVVQDIALIVEENVAGARVEELIHQTGGTSLAQVRLFDLYRGDPLPPGRKSLAYRLAFQAPDRGLTDADAAVIREKIVNRLKRELGAELRSG